VLPSFNIHSLYEEPEAKRQFREEAEDLNGGGEKVWDVREQKGQPAQTSKGRRHSQNAREEVRPEDEITDQQAKRPKNSRG
jgi:hypothetical protein